MVLQVQGVLFQLGGGGVPFAITHPDRDGAGGKSSPLPSVPLSLMSNLSKRWAQASAVRLKCSAWLGRTATRTKQFGVSLPDAVQPGRSETCRVLF